MSVIVENIISNAQSMGACKLAADDIKEVQDLARLFFTPQGREFCIGRNFPSIQNFRTLKTQHLSRHGVFCDMGSVEAYDRPNVAAIGKTLLYARYSENKELHQVILMHGAEAEITLSNYAVVHIEKTPDCKVKIINLDNTGIVL